MEMARLTTFGIAIALVFASLGLVIQYRYSELSSRLEVIETGYGAPPSVVGTAQITDKAITTAKLADSSVTTAKIGAAAVTGAKIADGSITAGDLASGAVTSVKILDETIATDDIADSAVTSAKIADGTIATGDIADSAVTSAKIADDAVDNSAIAENAVGSSEIADDAVGESEIAENAVKGDEIYENAVRSPEIWGGFIQSGCVDNTTENTAIIPPDNVGQPITVTFGTTFETVPIVTVSDNDENINVRVYDITGSDFKILLTWRLHGADTGVGESPYDMYDNIRWIAMVPKV